ncbi:S9 family peptidase [Wenzhouxiangella marina]|uniref:Peptidase S9 prolyl oligopeptidase active site domain protein n=1 Tax=Wenzhouxiangella marina TaxID=1579979 RepID=A0A0K0XV12_9GAMM|nr:S9 family peptidase [Wenzhouxiangella marina]AKS41549.1 Peptidase S9 prolyl oligopeptidase active site domain protein [Wenzhouxiangella marina]MBB6086692.1 dipeptidyl aminopeptidase/acylaminoacyl peptidase [Wenzhouxiangella marina]
MRFSFCLAILLVLIAPVSNAEPFNAEHLVTIDRIGAPVVSPDGQSVVYTLRRTDLDADTGRYDLWISPVAGGEARQLTSHPANDTSPAWSPDGRHVLFLSNRGEATQVWRIPVNGGEAEPVTDLPLGVGSFRIAPTENRLVVSMSVYLDCDDLTCTVERKAAEANSPISAKSYDQLFMRHWDHWLDETRSQLFSIQLDEAGIADGTPARVTMLDADIPSRIWGGNEEYAISPDGETLFFAARLRDANEPTSTNFDIYTTSLDDSGDDSGDNRGSPENLTEGNPAWDTAPVVSPDGRYLAYLAMSRPGFEADQYRIVLRDLRAGDNRVLTEGWDRSPSSIAFTADGQSILAVAQDVGHRTLWRFGLDGAAPVKLVDSGTVAGLDVAGEDIVYAMNSLGSPSELHVLDTDTGASRRITDVSSRTLAGVEMGEYEQFSFEGADGATVYGFVVKPVGFEAGATYPVAFLIHGGPQGSFSNNFHYRWNPQTYAGQGFAAVMIDFHGSTGYGQAFTDSISGDWGGKPLEDLQLGLAAALERYRFLDGDRVCALGASYGGYMINWIAGQWPERFRCLVNHDGIFDNRSMYYTTEELWFPEWEHGGPYFSNPEGYELHNPALYVDRWQTPMLVIHGELDYRVPVTQGIATFTALQRRGIESRFLYFPDENHWVLKPNNSIHWHEQVNEWLHKYLSEN